MVGAGVAGVGAFAGVAAFAGVGALAGEGALAGAAVSLDTALVAAASFSLFAAAATAAFAFFALPRAALRGALGRPLAVVVVAGASDFGVAALLSLFWGVFLLAGPEAAAG